MLTLLTLGQNTFIAQLIAPENIAIFVTGVSHQTAGLTLAFFRQRMNNQNDQEVASSVFLQKFFLEIRYLLISRYSDQKMKLYFAVSMAH